MASGVPTGYAFNRTRREYLATELFIANTHWSRLRGLMASAPGSFHAGQGLWIVPCRGVHTMAMRFPIDVIYLNKQNQVVHLAEDLRPWRFAPLRIAAASVLELPIHTIDRTQTVIGDMIDISLQQPRHSEAA
jgi:uncharacterized membrane protein (UPF0127 family)